SCAGSPLSSTVTQVITPLLSTCHRDIEPACPQSAKLTQPSSPAFLLTGLYTSFPLTICSASPAISIQALERRPQCFAKPGGSRPSYWAARLSMFRDFKLLY